MSEKDNESEAGSLRQGKVGLFFPGNSVLILAIERIADFYGFYTLERINSKTALNDIKLVLPDFIESAVDSRAQMFREDGREFDGVICLERELVESSDLDALLEQMRSPITTEPSEVFQRIHGEDYQRLCHELKYLLLSAARPSSWFYCCNGDSLSKWGELFERRLNKCSFLAESIVRRAGTESEFLVGERLGAFIFGIRTFLKDGLAQSLAPEAIRQRLIDAFEVLDKGAIRRLKQHWLKPELSGRDCFLLKADDYQALTLPSDAQTL